MPCSDEPSTSSGIWGVAAMVVDWVLSSVASRDDSICKFMWAVLA